MIRSFNFKSYLFKKMFSYIAISIISLTIISLSFGYFSNISQKSTTLKKLAKTTIPSEAKFTRNFKTIELPNYINLGKFRKFAYLNQLYVHKSFGTSNKKYVTNKAFTWKEQFTVAPQHILEYSYLNLGMTTYNKNKGSGNAINILKRSVQKSYNQLMYNFVNKLINF